MKVIKNFFLFIILGYCHHIYPINNSIILFVQKYPKIKIPKNKETIETLSKKLKQPGYAWEKIFKKNRFSSGAQGVMAMYLGYTSLSDKNGQITFLRKHQEPIINLLVTQSIQPVFILAPSTIHNWMINKNMPTKMYQFKFHKDPQTELYYIETKEIPLPQDSMIPLETILIITHPKNIFVPAGATITHYSPNLILPPIYVKKDFDYTYNVLYTNSIKHYFESITSNYKSEEQSVAKIITNN